MKPSVYLETTVISYLTARPSRDLVLAGHQETTREWWRDRRGDFDLFVSDIVIAEASAGDPEAADRRLEALQDITIININDRIRGVSRSLLTKAKLPRKAALDALHVAAAAIQGLDYLLTWNCTHIASGVFRPRLESQCRVLELRPPTICTPHELM